MEDSEFIRMLGSIICSSILMWKYRALNKEKEELCQREGIDGKMEDKYSELGDKSPLFRWAPFLWLQNRRLKTFTAMSFELCGGTMLGIIVFCYLLF